jgi:hypothetical protein
LSLRQVRRRRVSLSLRFNRSSYYQRPGFQVARPKCSPGHEGPDSEPTELTGSLLSLHAGLASEVASASGVFNVTVAGSLRPRPGLAAGDSPPQSCHARKRRPGAFDFRLRKKPGTPDARDHAPIPSLSPLPAEAPSRRPRAGGRPGLRLPGIPRLHGNPAPGGSSLGDSQWH